jgi:hypothetical protein
MKNGKVERLPLLGLKARCRTLGSQSDGQGMSLRTVRMLKPAFIKEDLKCV